MKNKIASLQHFLSKKTGRAISEFDLIKPDDKILVGISGGKDSMSLLNILAYRRARSPINYELIPIHIDFGFDDEKQVLDMQKYVKTTGYELLMRHHKLKPIPDHKKDKYCFFCSSNRRRLLFEEADRLGCNKIALGHHIDDVIQTILLNMFFHGEFSTMMPKQSLFKGKLELIRPFYYVEEKELATFARKCEIPIVSCNCSKKQNNKRPQMSEIVDIVKKIYPRVKYNIVMSTKRVKKDYILPQIE